MTPTEALKALCDLFGDSGSRHDDGHGEMILGEFLEKYEVQERGSTAELLDRMAVALESNLRTEQVNVDAMSVHMIGMAEIRNDQARKFRKIRSIMEEE